MVLSEPVTRAAIRSSRTPTTRLYLQSQTGRRCYKGFSIFNRTAALRILRPCVT
jgi:hypothetical protein